MCHVNLVIFHSCSDCYSTSNNMNNFTIDLEYQSIFLGITLHHLPHRTYQNKVSKEMYELHRQPRKTHYKYYLQQGLISSTNKVQFMEYFNQLHSKWYKTKKIFVTPKIKIENIILILNWLNVCTSQVFNMKYYTSCNHRYTISPVKLICKPQQYRCKMSR